MAYDKPEGKQVTSNSKLVVFLPKRPALEVTILLLGTELLWPF